MTAQLPPRFEDASDLFEWVGAKSHLGVFARNVFASLGTAGFNPVLASIDISAEEIIDLLCTTIVVILTFSLSPKISSFQGRRQKFKSVFELLQPMQDEGAKLPYFDLAEMWDYLLAKKKTPGRPLKLLRLKVVARMVGFHEFVTGRESWAAGEDPRIGDFLQKSVGFLAQVLRSSGDKFLIDLGSELMIPENIGALLAKSKDQSDDLACASRVFWGLLIHVYPEKVRAIERV